MSGLRKAFIKLSSKVDPNSKLSQTTYMQSISISHRLSRDARDLTMPMKSAFSQIFSDAFLPQQ
jgi:hypothetical protein